MKLTLQEITSLQSQYGVSKIQGLIETGDIWSFEGSMGRFGMECLETGICYLPERNTFDFYGSMVPARGLLEEGTKGSLGNSQNFWQKVYDNDFDVIDSLEGMFGN